MLEFIKRTLGLTPSILSPAEADPILGPAVALAKRLDVGPLMALFAANPDHPRLRIACVAAAVSHYFLGHPNREAMYDAWVAGRPGDLFGRLARARLKGDLIPGYNPGDADAKAKAARGDKLRLEAAEDLRVAQEIAGDDLTVEAIAFCTERADRRSARAYESLVARAPTLLPVHDAWFWHRTERWRGKAGDTLTLGRALAASAPGSDQALFPLYAHWEHHWYVDAMLKDAAAANAYLQRPDVRAECVAAYDATLGCASYVPTFDTWWLRQLASRWFHLVTTATSDDADRARAKDELARMGRVFVPRDSKFWWMSEQKWTELRKGYGVK